LRPAFPPLPSSLLSVLEYWSPATGSPKISESSSTPSFIWRFFAPAGVVTFPLFQKVSHSFLPRPGTQFCSREFFPRAFTRRVETGLPRRLLFFPCLNFFSLFLPRRTFFSSFPSPTYDGGISPWFFIQNMRVLLVLARETGASA